MNNKCVKCGYHHFGITCPDIKMIDYYSNGQIKRIEYYPSYDKRLEKELEIKMREELRKLERKEKSTTLP